jgi:hypothetical protein
MMNEEAIRKFISEWCGKQGIRYPDFPFVELIQAVLDQTQKKRKNPSFRTAAEGIDGYYNSYFGRNGALPKTSNVIAFIIPIIQALVEQAEGSYNEKLVKHIAGLCVLLNDDSLGKVVRKINEELLKEARHTQRGGE